MTAFDTDYETLDDAPRTPLVWTRRLASKQNIVVLNDREIAVATLPGSTLDKAREALTAGEPTMTVLGPLAVNVSLGAIYAVHATLGQNELEVQYEKGLGGIGRVAFPLPDDDAPTEALLAIHERLGTEAEVQRRSPNRFIHMMRPFNFFVIIALLGGAFNWIATNVYDAPRAKLSWQSWEPNNRDYQYQYHRSRGYTGRDASAKAAGVVVLAIVATGLLLVLLGYETTLMVFIACASVAIVWSLLRLLRPPVTYSVITAKA